MAEASPAERCELARAVLHLDGPKGRELEWYATECGRWPVNVDVSLRCGGAWEPLFGRDAIPSCADEQFVAVNVRGHSTRERGLWLQLLPADGGFAFVVKPAVLSAGSLQGEPRDVGSMCGAVAGQVARADGGWSAHTVEEP